MGKQVRLSEEELSNLIKNKVMEAIEKTGLGYLPAIGNKKRGPGNEIEDQMRKRKNKKLDEAFDEISGFVIGRADRFEDADVNETIELSNDAYAYAFEQIYGRVPGDLPDILEDFPEDVDVRFSLSTRISPQTYDFPEDRETEITDWTINDEWVANLDNEKQEIIRKAAEYVIANINPGDIVPLYESKKNVVKINEDTLRHIITESVKKMLNENFYDYSRSGNFEYQGIEGNPESEKRTRKIRDFARNKEKTYSHPGSYHIPGESLKNRNPYAIARSLYGGKDAKSTHDSFDELIKPLSDKLNKMPDGEEKGKIHDLYQKFWGVYNEWAKENRHE